jgi:hypothetical protein
VLPADHIRIIDLTVGELRRVIQHEMRRPAETPAASAHATGADGPALKLSAVARRLGVSPKTARKKCREGVWPHVNVGTGSRPVYKVTLAQMAVIESGESQAQVQPGAELKPAGPR